MANEKVQETKLFSNHAADAEWLKALRGSSMSAADAAHRKTEYNKLFSKYESLKEAYKMFSGVTENPILSNQYFNATIASFVRSFAGYLAIERDMAEPTALLWYDDVLGVVDDRIVLPNVGQEDLSQIEGAVDYADVTIAQAAVSVAAGKVIVPGSFKAVLAPKADAATFTAPVEMVDDHHGNILAQAGAITAGTINYATGAISFTVATDFVGGKYSIHAMADVPGTPTYGNIASNQKNRFKLGLKNIMVNSEADMLIAESNLVSTAQANKSLGQNPMDVLGAKLVELYTKIINGKLVASTMEAAQGNAYTIDASGWKTSFYDFRSRLDAYSAELVTVDTELAIQSIKGVEATCYLCDPMSGNWFRRMRATGEFTEEKGSTYVNDLLGYYHDRPVLRHTGIPQNTFFAVHKTAGGELAPSMLGQYLPLTFTPNIGSYSNPSQLATGAFYQLGCRPVASLLVKKVVISE